MPRVPELTQAARDRAYKVQIAALAEEQKVCKLSTEEVLQRMRDIWENCYGDQKDQP